MNRDDMVERVAEALWREDFRRGAGRERITTWAEAGDHPHMQWRSLARAALAIIEPCVREECAQIVMTRAPGADAINRATTAAAIRAGAKP